MSKPPERPPPPSDLDQVQESESAWPNEHEAEWTNTLWNEEPRWWSSLGYWHYVAVRFFLDWLTSRPWWSLAAGVPAILASFLAVTTLMRAPAADSWEALETYRRAARDALATGRAAESILATQRLSEHPLATAADQFLLVPAAVRAGDFPRANHWARRLGPDDRPGYPEAHYWRAVQSLIAAPNDSARVAHAIAQLRFALAGDPHLTPAQEQLGRLLISQGKWAEALEYLRPLRERDPVLSAPLARIYQQLQRTDDAAQEARRGLRELEPQLRGSLALSPARLAVADLQLVLGQYAQSEESLRQVPLPDRNGDWRRAMVTVLASWFDADAQGTVPTAQQLELLQRMLRLAPADPDVLVRLQRATQLDAAALSRVREDLEAALVAGQNTAAAHLLLGTAAVQAGDRGAGLRHLELAFQEDPTTPVLANNLAWTLSQGPQPDLDRAAALIEVAVQAAPEHAEFRETRGQIRARRGDVPGAIADLEFALRSFPERPEIHTTLADLYQQLNEPGLAERHRRRARETPAARALGHDKDSPD